MIVNLTATATATAVARLVSVPVTVMVTVTAMMIGLPRLISLLIQTFYDASIFFITVENLNLM